MNREQKQALWQRGYRYLERFIEREGHSLVPYPYVYRGFKLGKWVNTQRAKRDPFVDRPVAGDREWTSVCAFR